MKRIMLVVACATLYARVVESTSLAARVGDFCLESIDRGFGNNKKITLLAVACTGLYVVWADKVPVKKRILQATGAGLAVAGVGGVFDTLRARIWPNASDIAAREQEKKDQARLERFEKERQELPVKIAQYKTQIAEIEKEAERIALERDRDGVRRQFNKVLMEHLDDPCEAGSIPQACEKVAQEFRTLFGEELYRVEVAAFHKLRGLDIGKIVSRA